MLTDVQCRNATCPPDKPRERFADSGGLYLEVTPTGIKRWFWKFRLDTKERRMALGNYPVVGLTAARRARDAARNLKDEGKDPVRDRQLGKAATASGVNGRVEPTFGEAAEEWFRRNKDSWSDGYAVRERRNLNKDLLPWLGGKPISKVDGSELLKAVRRVEERGSIDISHRVVGTARAVFKYAVAAGLMTSNPAIGIEPALIKHRKKHYAAVTDPKQLAPLLRAVDAYQGGFVVRTALKLAPMLFQRPNELRGMEWSELDLDNAMWTIAPSRMKRRKEEKENGPPHYVPLPKQAVTLLRDIQPLTGNSKFVFPGERSHDRTISDNTLRAALLTLGIGSTEQTIHGFRATARTILGEVLEFDPAIVEAQLAHAVKDANGRAYNRTTFLKQRAEMMQRWADYLDQLRHSKAPSPAEASTSHVAPSTA